MDVNSVNQLTFWWSILATGIDLVLLIWGVWQFASSRKDEEIQLKEKELHKSQVKIWQHFANGINHNLLLITEAIRNGKLKSLKAEDFGDVLRAVQANASALYTSLNEERLFSEEEIKQRQLEQEERVKQMLKGPSTSTSPSASLVKKTS